MFSKSQILVDPVNVGEGATSDAPIRPASESIMGRNTNRCQKPRKSLKDRQRGSGRSSREAGGVPISSFSMEIRGTAVRPHQHEDGIMGSSCQSPRGVESGPTIDKGKLSEPGNPAAASFGMTEAIGERNGGGRSSRSSQRTGKPSTGRRGTVETASTQEGGGDTSNPVNTGGFLDMQCKLFRWSRNDPKKTYSDLFNLVCDRRTLARAWDRLAKNHGSRTPGVDGMTRRKVEERAGGVSGFLEGIRNELCSGTYEPQPVRQRLIPKPGKPGKFRPLGIFTLRDRLV